MPDPQTTPPILSRDQIAVIRNCSAAGEEEGTQLKILCDMASKYLDLLEVISRTLAEELHAKA